jgi:ABC-2 type transport system ATP-binding protein
LADELIISGCTFGYSQRAKVLENLTLAFSPGATVLLGPNGAGKSTLLGLLASIYRPQVGSVELRGVGSTTNRRTARQYRSSVAWLPQHAGIFAGLTVREHVAYAGWLKGMKRQDAWSRAAEALKAMDLQDFEARPAKKLSGGQARRMQLAGALVHDAQVVLLDEPTAGLDPLQQARFGELIQSLPDHIVTIVATHDVNDLSESFSRVVVIDGGQIRFEDTVENFTATAPAEVESHRRGLVAYSQIVQAES